MSLGSWGAIVGNVLLFGLVVGLAATVEREAFVRSMKSRALVVGAFAQFAFLPLVGFGCAKAFFADDPALGIPLIITTSSPGGSYSNWWTSLFNGDLSLSVAMTTVSSIASVGFLPLNLYMYTEGAYPHEAKIKVKWAGLFVSIGVVIGAIVSGLFIGTRWPRSRKTLNVAGNMFGVLLVLLGFFFSSNSSAPIWSRGWKFYIGLMIPCFAGMIVSLIWARILQLERPQALAVAIEVVYQNTAIALAVILSSFSNDTSCTNVASNDCDVVGIAAGVPTFYQLIQILSLGVLCVTSWRLGWTYAPVGTPLLKALATNFQPSTHVEYRQDQIDQSTSAQDLELARSGQGVEMSADVREHVAPA
ncbi:Bile acid:sodium symporter [Ostreococcus tauri]|uniref:Bile acid:sodium symporter n=1 Tax=Ostreococcus tauri TaxID=70448 RepID=A0A096P803_OSTTA|nr:Bile acid:sodium symporter [Ostreococcus tauri]CEG00103.1 Bile acid:sodium symporter [Ostreococcus tauri]|eukprot:XP_003082619.2 Bile acid:sodium symporter [Ostreococcus tauri]